MRIILLVIPGATWLAPHSLIAGFSLQPLKFPFCILPKEPCLPLRPASVSEILVLLQTSGFTFFCCSAALLLCCSVAAASRLTALHCPLLARSGREQQLLQHHRK
jgi:hypothetical protein